MKRIVLTALDYGHAFGVDRAIRDLLADNRLTAVGCLTASDRWPREYLPLREQVERSGERTRVGVTIALTRPFVPLTPAGQDAFGARFPSLFAYRIKDPLWLMPRKALRAEIDMQLERFEEYYGFAPDFVALQQGLDRRIGLVKLVIEAMVARYETLPAFFFREPERLRCRLLARRLRKRGGESNPEAVSLPATTDARELHRFFWYGLEGRRDGTCVWCAPGQADERLRAIASPSEIAVREAQFAYLNSPEFLMALTEKDVFLF